MSAAVQFIQDLAACGVRLERNGDKLRVTAPAGVLTAEIKARLAQNKEDLLAALGDMRLGPGISTVAVPVVGARAWRGWDAPASATGASWAEWKARQLNGLFRDLGVIGRTGRITAATVEHGARAGGGQKQKRVLLQK